MTPINPFSGYLAQGAQLDRMQAAEKTRQARRVHGLSKNIAARDDEMEHQVESTDRISDIHDQPPGRDPQGGGGKHPPAEDAAEETPHLDITG